MEKTRTYIDKGDRPLFLDVALEGATVHDRVPPDRRAALLELAARGGAVVVPAGNRAGVAELVELARDEEQGWYRALWIEAAGRVRACLGFGRVSGCDDTYDVLGVVAEDASWADRGLDAMARWLGSAGARLARFEVDEGNAEVARSALSHGFAEEGRIADFYRQGSAQRMLIWRPRR